MDPYKAAWIALKHYLLARRDKLTYDEMLMLEIEYGISDVLAGEETS